MVFKEEIPKSMTVDSELKMYESELAAIQDSVVQWENN